MAWRRHIGAASVGLIVLSMVAAGCSRSSSATTGAEKPDRTFHLRAEDTHFVLEGERDPTLVVEEGERVRLTFENTQHGVQHALAVPPFTDDVREVKSGERASVTFVASKSGAFEYTCPHHVPIMKGELIVRSADSGPSE